MTRRERLLASIRGTPVDRPPVCFYEINGITQDPNNADPYNIFNHPSWRPALDLARTQSDLIIMCGVPFRNAPPNPAPELYQNEKWEEGDSRFYRTTIRAGQRTLTATGRHDRDVNTGWATEHLLKNVDDVKAWLDLPVTPFGGTPDPSGVLAMEQRLGEDGIVMLDTGDPICSAASMFHMQDYAVLAVEEPALFQRVLERHAATILPRVAAIAQALPGRLWRIYGPEYASPPYLPPRLYPEIVTRYLRPMVESIQRHGGYARVHSHGRLKAILGELASTGCTGLDPIEPPPQGDVALAYVREQVGQQMTLFGNLEASDIENLPTPQFGEKIRRALGEGTAGSGRGFVLMPSACPYGRLLSKLAMYNYEKMVELAEA